MIQFLRLRAVQNQRCRRALQPGCNYPKAIGRFDKTANGCHAGLAMRSIAGFQTLRLKLSFRVSGRPEATRNFGPLARERFLFRSQPRGCAGLPGVVSLRPGMAPEHATLQSPEGYKVPVPRGVPKVCFRVAACGAVTERSEVAGLRCGRLRPARCRGKTPYGGSPNPRERKAESFCAIRRIAGPAAKPLYRFVRRARLKPERANS